jgi:hypothetical protein
LRKENIQLKHEIDLLKKQHTNENQMVKEVSKTVFVAL